MHCIYETSKFIFFFFTFFILLSSNQETFGIGKISKRDKITVKDVLFINGCYTKQVPHPYRYRVLHQMEQLNAGFLESDEIFYLSLEPIFVRNYRIIIFFRCPWTEKVEEAIELAKFLNKKVLFDIDDLVIDTKYTEMIPYLKTLSQKEKALYDDGVVRMGKTLKLCEGAITTTKTLAKELKYYVPNVFINHNVASEEMWKLSQNALIEKDIKNKNNHIIIGYFSGSITHNPDIEMISPSLKKILNEFKNVQLLLFGEISVKNIFKEYSSQIIYKKFNDWKNLPKVMSNIDINLAPIVNNIFNAAKSENKWVEAALVKVPTIASNFGAFKDIIKHNETGLLCSNQNEWYSSLKILVQNQNLRKVLGENAYSVCKTEYNTVYTGKKFADYLNSIANKHIGFFLPNLKISGGIYVILKHACILQDEGWDVDLINSDSNFNLFEFQDHKFNVINLNNSTISSNYDIIVASLFTTVFSILNYFRTKNHLYLVQNYETDFYKYGNYFRIVAEQTYSAPFNVEYITISKWCETWLWEKYKKKSRYAPNGIDFYSFTSQRRKLTKKKIRILIEGDSSSHYKNVDESFKIIEKLDKNKFEVWYLSYNGKPKNWYQFDKFFHEISHDKVKSIYRQCDILLKSSFLESFSYPPLEMMATGGYNIVVPNGGNTEYLKDGENCLFYKLGDINGAVECIKRLISDEELQIHLYENGLRTAEERDWKNFKKQVISLYSQ